MALIGQVSAEERYRTLVDAIKDYAIFLLDARGYIATWNAGAERIKGYTADEVVGRHISIFYPSEDIARGYSDEILARAAEHGHWEDEGWRVRRDGTRFWADIVVTALRDSHGTLTGFAKVTRDLTERNRLRQLEHASELAAHIEATREEEKKRIARELHDDLGQQLTALKMDLAGADTRDPASVAMLRAAVDRAIVSVRRLAAGLRPAVLDDLGLVPALEWLVDDFRQRSGLHVSLALKDGGVVFNEAASTALFRIVQEALSNVGRHARGATAVEVAFCCDAGHCTLSIRDNGSPATRSTDETVRDGPPPSGLAGVRDRIRRLGGSAAIGPRPEGGFLIEISLPLDTLR